MPLRLTSGMSHEGATVWTFEIYYRRLLIAAASLAVAGYFLAATALYVWLDRQPRNQVGWSDLAAPWRWSTLSTKRGDTAVMTALDELKKHDYVGAFHNLRVGLARSPGNVTGRLTLAQLWGINEPVQAVRIMEEGIPACVGDDKFLEALLATYASQQIQAHALETIGSLLQASPSPLSPTGRAILERGRFTLWLQMGRYAEVEAALPALRAADPALANLLECEWRLRTQRWAEARQIFEAHFSGRLKETEVARLALDLAVGTGDADLLSRVVRRLKAQAPDSPTPHLLAIQGWQRMKRSSLRDAAEQEFYQLFATNETALQMLGAMGVAQNIPDIVARAARVAAANQFSQFAFQVHQTELALRNQQVDLAMQSLPRWESDVDSLKKRQQFHPEFIRRLALAVFTGAADQQATLISHLQANRSVTRPSIYLLAATVLEQAGELAGAAQVLQAAEPVFQFSDALLEARRRIEARLNADKVTPPPEAQASSLPTTAAKALAQIEMLLAQDAFVASRDLLRALRAKKPAWWSEAEISLAAREVELAYLTLDPLASRSMVRVYLDRHRGEEGLLALVPVVARLAARGNEKEAQLLQDEINSGAGVGGAPRAQQALREVNLVDDLAGGMAKRAEALAWLDRALACQDWVSAERGLKYLREKPPAWGTDAMVELKSREVLLRLAMDQRLLALAALKELVNKGGVARGAAFKLAREQLARGDVATAQVLAREIGRLLPDDAAAARLLRETETSSAAK